MSCLDWRQDNVGSGLYDRKGLDRHTQPTLTPGLSASRIARHEVIPEEVEEICHSDSLVQQGHTGRLLIIGLTKGNRTITVIIDPEPEKGVYYVVTARFSSTKERKIYRHEKGDESNE